MEKKIKKNAFRQDLLLLLFGFKYGKILLLNL